MAYYLIPVASYQDKLSPKSNRQKLWPLTHAGSLWSPTVRVASSPQSPPHAFGPVMEISKLLTLVLIFFLYLPESRLEPHHYVEG